MHSFETEMQKLIGSVAKLGGAAEEQLSHALDAVGRRDGDFAREVIAGDAALDAMEADIEKQVAGLFVRRQPMATDLRVALSSIKIASAIERVGDLAKNTARRSLMLNDNPALKIVQPILRFGKETLGQFSECMEAYAQRDVDLAMAVWKRDEQLDLLYNSLMSDIIGQMAEEPEQIPLYTQTMFISKNMERIGDHATFIAEMTYYIVTGAPPAEDRPKGPPDGLFATAK
jgi:phosphate transport system protein